MPGANRRRGLIWMLWFLEMGEEDYRQYSEKLLDLTVDLATRYGVIVSIQENNIDFFNEWADTLPFFHNVINEGVELYGK